MFTVRFNTLLPISFISLCVLTMLGLLVRGVDFTRLLVPVVLIFASFRAFSAVYFSVYMQTVTFRISFTAVKPFEFHSAEVRSGRLHFLDATGKTLLSVATWLCRTEDVSALVKQFPASSKE